MRSRVLQRVAGAAVLALGLGVTVATTASAARPDRSARRRPGASAFRLFQGARNVVMNVNRIQCNINNVGETCVDPTNSPIIGGGYWPKGTPDQYIFNAGLQLAGIIPGTAGFAWQGDTVGAFFFDPKGTEVHGDPRTNVFDAGNAADLADWPTAAEIRDTSLFNLALIGPPFGTAPAFRKTVSQQDTWVRYWDGNVNLTAGRKHPMGIVVEQRGLMWNFPSGNQDIVYFLYRFINASARDASVYQQPLLDAGYLQADIDEIAAIGADFQDRAEAQYNVQIPDGGFPIANMFAAFAMDPDVADAGSNYSTADLPFAMGAAYKSDFKDVSWSYPPDIFAPPFAAAPGFVGVKYLRSPIDPVTQTQFGISVFSNTTNGNPFPDSRGVQQLWRYLSGNASASAGDNSCTNGPAPTTHFCTLVNTAQDTRFFQSSGPFTLDPGQSAVIVVAYVHAAPVAAYTIPRIGNVTAGAPGTPPSPAALATGTAPRGIDSMMGWVTSTDANANGRIEQTEVTSVRRSLLDKAIVAQAVFDNRFLLPFAPEPPTFYVVPGDNQVTIAWQQSESENPDPAIGGDPYFSIASNPASPLYDPNFRKYDVEGYRIWRGRTTAQMEVIAQFDYAGTTITDQNGAFYNVADYGNRCAPELLITSTCPPFPHDYLLSGKVQQIPPGGRVALLSGDVFNVVVDTAIVGGGSGLPELTDNGVPFAYTDRSVRNGFRYYYAVSAFDINTVKSGPSSLGSPLITKTVTPRAPAANAQLTVVTGLYGEDGVTRLDPTAPFPRIDPNDGTFSGIVPPANGGSFGFLGAVLEALPPGDITLRVDSVTGGFAGGFTGDPADFPVLYYSLSSATDTLGDQTARLEVPSFGWNYADDVTADTIGFPFVRYDSSRARTMGLAFTQDVRMPLAFTVQIAPLLGTPLGAAMRMPRGSQGPPLTRQASRWLAHSRWSDEGGQEPPDPTISWAASASNTNGGLTGVTRIYEPGAYRQPSDADGLPNPVNRLLRYYSYAMVVWYPADFVVTWNADSTITVRDSSNRTTLPFMDHLGTGWGFINVRAFQASGVTAGELDDGSGSPNVGVAGYHHLYGVGPVCIPNAWAITCSLLESKAQYQPLDLDNNGTADGNGIALIINGEPFFMEMAALPAAGTQWHFKAVGGMGMSATCVPVIPSSLTAPPPAFQDCHNYSFTPTLSQRWAYVPGIQYKISVVNAFAITAESGDLSRIHTVPDPYYVTNQLEITANTKVLRFVNLPERAIIRIYSSSGILVNVVTHNDPRGGGEEVWNLRNRNNQFVASGVYFYHVETADGREKIGRFTVVNFAQ